MQLVLKDGLLIQKVVDEMVILEPQTGDYFTLNSIGALMLEKLQAGSSSEQVAQIISDEYDVSAQQVAQDLAELLGNLEQAGLAQKQDA
ncbi:PqqD family protein [Paraglaciecola sp. 25GB23A]|uniref:PqqD family protein n=1 Tax=Paraglaciecola sp. 25GB23A TaxID=3156068 RepID=UPI0032AEE524|tara:strand:+ start:252 stop:518 length:267 start_codon:yes stop_codon:yes gene_type:complete